MTPPAPFDFRALRIRRLPTTNMPWTGADPEWTWTAEYGDAEVGAYELKRLGPTRFSIVGLKVHEDYRGLGIGRWLLLHAVGTAESSGAREIEAPPNESFFEHQGFRPKAHVLRLTLTPE